MERQRSPTGLLTNTHTWTQQNKTNVIPTSSQRRMGLWERDKAEVLPHTQVWPAGLALMSHRYLFLQLPLWAQGISALRGETEPFQSQLLSLGLPLKRPYLILIFFLPPSKELTGRRGSSAVSSWSRTMSQTAELCPLKQTGFSSLPRTSNL